MFAYRVDCYSTNGNSQEGKNIPEEDLAIIDTYKLLVAKADNQIINSIWIAPLMKDF